MMLVPAPSTQYGKDFRRIVQSTKFNQAAYLTVLSLLITGNPLPAKMQQPSFEWRLRRLLGLPYHQRLCLDLQN